MATESKCHYRRHLRGPDLTTYELALAISKDSGVFFASAEYIRGCTAYRGVQTIRAALRRLCHDGWLVQVAGNRDTGRQGGKFLPNTYRVVKHGEWAAAHPDRCDPVPVTPIPVLPIPVTSISDETHPTDTGETNATDTGVTGNNLSIELSKRAECASAPSAAWNALEIKPVGSANFQRRYEKQFAQFGPVDVPTFLRFLESFYDGCMIDGVSVPPEWVTASRKIAR
jgi:hypothetical protein